MKKVDVEKKISKSLIITGIVLLVMFCMVLIEKAYNNPYASVVRIGDQNELVINIVTLVLSIVLLIVAGVSVFLGFKKNQKFFEASAWCAGLATLTMLIKINHEAKVLVRVATSKLNEGAHALLKINLPEAFSFFGVVTFYEIAQFAFFLYLIGLWIHTIYVVNKK